MYWLFPLLLLAPTAFAQIYPWSLSEIYSSPDGSIQFMELTTEPAPGGLLGSGYQFKASNPLGTLNHFYATGVSQFSGGGYQSLLFATTGFAQLPGAIAPDYIIPSGFLFTPGGSLLEETLSGGFGSSTLSYSALPTDGMHALDANGDVVPAVAINFAGQIYDAPEPTSLTLMSAGFIIVCAGFGRKFGVPAPRVV